MSAFNDPRLLKAERERRRGPVCAGCGYDLTGLPPKAPCPECGRPREDATRRRAALQTSKILDADGVDLWRFQFGFFVVGVVMLAGPAAVILTWQLAAGAVEWVVAGCSGMWCVGVYALVLEPFGKGLRRGRFDIVMRGVGVGTQWAWLAAAFAYGQGGVWVWVTAVLWGVGGLGLAGVFWTLGTDLEWAGDDTGGRRARLAVTYFLSALLWAALGSVVFVMVSPLRAIRMPVIVGLVFFGPLVIVYLRIAAALVGGASMAHWARIHQRDAATRRERLDARREEIEAAQRLRADRNERAHVARRAGAEKPVGLDDLTE